MTNLFTKDPAADLDYTIDWETWLDGDTIAASAWTVPAGLTSDLNTFSDTRATVWLQGGTDYSDYTVVNRITTAAGRIDERTITIRVRER